MYRGDGKILPSFLESANFEIEDGNRIMFVDRIIPDYTISNNGSIDITLQFQEYPNGPTVTKGPFTIQQSTKKVDLRGRGRQAKYIVSASTDGTWRWGAVRANIQPDGMR